MRDSLLHGGLALFLLKDFGVATSVFDARPRESVETLRSGMFFCQHQLGIDGQTAAGRKISRLIAKTLAT